MERKNKQRTTFWFLVLECLYKLKIVPFFRYETFLVFADFGFGFSLSNNGIPWNKDIPLTRPFLEFHNKERNICKQNPLHRVMAKLVTIDIVCLGLFVQRSAQSLSEKDKPPQALIFSPLPLGAS